MKKIILKRNDFQSEQEFYVLIRHKLLLPSWFGNNLDALWDMLTGYIETPVEIEFVGFNKKDNEYNEHYISRILQCFKDAEKENPNEIKITFKDE